MQVINHHDGNYTYADPTDSSVMYGTIKMNLGEFTDALFYLEDEYKRAKRQTNTYIRDGLSHLFNYTLSQWAKRKAENRYPDCNNCVCLGMTATELLFKKYNLPRYKRHNYLIVITK
jgi:hypothetical protein